VIQILFPAPMVTDSIIFSKTSFTKPDTTWCFVQDEKLWQIIKKLDTKPSNTLKSKHKSAVFVYETGGAVLNKNPLI
jgi:hypothetical protein